MSAPEVAVYIDPRDLLNRLVPTPFEKVSFVGGQTIKAQSNDQGLLAALPRVEFETREIVRADVFWKLIRDVAVHGPFAPGIMLRTDEVVAVFAGPACLAVVDQGQRRLVAFVGTDIDGRTYREEVLPVLSRLSRACGSAETDGVRVAGAADSASHTGSGPKERVAFAQGGKVMLWM